LTKSKSNYICRYFCRNFEGYEKGHYSFAVEGKDWCSVCDYKRVPEKNRYCGCCGCRFRVKARTDKILQRKNQQELNSHFEIVAIYQKQI